MASNFFKSLLLQFLSDSDETWHTRSLCHYAKTMEHIFEILVSKFLAIFFIISHFDLVSAAAAAAVELFRRTGLTSLMAVTSAIVVLRSSEEVKNRLRRKNLLLASVHVLCICYAACSSTAYIMS